MGYVGVMVDKESEGLIIGDQEICEGLSMVVSVCNEQNSVELILEDLLEALNHLNSPTDLIVVDDGSTDFTPEALKRFGAQVKLFHRIVNKGYTSALKTNHNNDFSHDLRWL